MKVYEFTYSDNQNLSAEELSKRVESFLLKESDLQGWMPGYKFQQAGSEKKPEGHTVYLFEVFGNYLDEKNTTFESESKASDAISNEFAAREITL